MKILVISNFYPPYHIGGYELACYQVVEGLLRRGHDVKVLTSRYQLQKGIVDGKVIRTLKLYEGWLKPGSTPSRFGLFSIEMNNQGVVREILNNFKPDVVQVWNPGSISITVAMWAILSDVPVCFFVSDRWVEFLKADNDPWFKFWRRVPSNHIKLFAKTIAHSLVAAFGYLVEPVDIYNSARFDFVSNYLKQKAIDSGKSLHEAGVIYHGIDLDQFVYHREVSGQPYRLMYSGRLSPEKGVHIVIEAVKILVYEYGFDQIKLDIIGGSIYSDYDQHLHQLVTQLGLQRYVTFHGFLEREKLPNIYQNNHIFIFPSSWDEPFSLALLEAMASGLAVVSTNTGGSAEILEHKINCLVFETNNSRDCASKVAELMQDKALYESIRRVARNIVEQRFSEAAMLRLIEQRLINAKK